MLWGRSQEVIWAFGYPQHSWGVDMIEGVFIALVVSAIAMVAMSLSTMFYARCRDCRVKIYKHTIHKCPVSGKRYRGM